MPNELKPCALCGGEAEIERKGTLAQSMIIACTNCGLRLESGDVYGLTKPENWRWNTRPQVDRERIKQAIIRTPVNITGKHGLVHGFVVADLLTSEVVDVMTSEIIKELT